MFFLYRFIKTLRLKEIFLKYLKIKFTLKTYRYYCENILYKLQYKLTLLFTCFFKNIEFFIL